MDDIEERLRRFRPAGPPPTLRVRVVSAASDHAVAARRFPRSVLAPIVAWVPAAAAVILIALFSWMASTERGRIEARVLPSTDDVVTAPAVEVWP